MYIIPQKSLLSMEVYLKLFLQITLRVNLVVVCFHCIASPLRWVDTKKIGHSLISGHVYIASVTQLITASCFRLELYDTKSLVFTLD